MPWVSSSGFWRALGVGALTALVAACGSIGPRTMDRDQLDYGDSVSNNWKNQMLVNVVKIRYVDMPVFIDVGSIVAGYSLETQVNGRIGFSDSITGGDSQTLGAGGRYTDRPTITYIPKTGNQYLRSLLTPVEPKNLLSLIQVGYNAELLFTWSVEAINGIHNYSVTLDNTLQAEPEFLEVTGLIRKLQIHGVIAWEIVTDPGSEQDVLLVLNPLGPDNDLLHERERLAELLGLNPELDRFRVVYAPARLGSNVLAIQTRSVLQMLGAMSGFVEVPPDLAGQAAPGYRVAGGSKRPFHVHSGPDRPDASFAAVRYGDYWYWIENDDLLSKRVFTLMLFLTTLTNQPNADSGPVLTIPTG